MNQNAPYGIVISALKGGAGKTILSLGLISSLKNTYKKSIAPFKKGPDYIDASWLSLAAKNPAYNLDSYLIESSILKQSFLENSYNKDISIIEGNRGIFDGTDIYGKTSTAELAKLLRLPVILCLDCTKVTRTLAASLLGCLHFDKDLQIKGVVLNQVAGIRHKKAIEENIKAHTNIPVLGAMFRLKEEKFPERHLGLLPVYEHKDSLKAINTAQKLVEDSVDIKQIIEIAEQSQSIPYSNIPQFKKEKPKVKIAVCRDKVFQFYYEENLTALEKNGAELIFLSPLSNKKIPKINAMYIGGGFPESNPEKLSSNLEFKKQLKSLIEKGLPVYAECGGLLYLSKSLKVNKKTYPMLNIFPLSFDFDKRPQGHGYMLVEVEKENPFYPIHTKIKGHEFRYSKIIKAEKNLNMAFKVERGVGIINQQDGISYKNVLASYIHIHSLGTKIWAEKMIAKALEFKNNYE